MLNFLFKLMLLLPIFQTWLQWNGIGVAQYFEHIIYLVLAAFCVYEMGVKNVKLNKNMIFLFFLFFTFLFIGVLTSLIQNILHDYISIPGIAWEVYKLSRNLFIFLFAYYFQTKFQFLQNIKLYLKVSVVLIIIAIFQYFFGLKAYEFLKFLPNREENPYFYSSYLTQNRSMGLLKHPNVFGEFVSISFLILIYAVSMKVKIFKKRSTQNIILLLSLIGVFVSASRSVFLLCLAIPFVISIFLRMKKVRKVYTFLLILSAPFLYFAIEQLLYKLWQYSYYTIEKGNTEVRLIYWQNSWEIFKNNLLGSGLGTWGDASAAYATYKPFGYINTMSDAYLSHLIAENGVNIIFLVIISSVFFVSLVKCYLNHNDTFDKYINALAISLMIFTAISSLKSMQLSMFENSYFIFYILGYVYKVNSSSRENVKVKTNDQLSLNNNYNSEIMQIRE